MDDNLSFMLPPGEPKQPSDANNDPAADLIRQKVERAYANEPNASQQVLSAAEQAYGLRQPSKHQRFILDLALSGKSLPEIQQAWHQYYLSLSDLEKHQVWEEFYASHANTSKFAAARPDLNTTKQVAVTDNGRLLKQPAKTSGIIRQTIADIKAMIGESVSPKVPVKRHQHLRSLVFGLAVGVFTVLILMFGFFNERFIAPLIQPSRVVTNTPIISQDSATDQEPEIIIPKINVEIPVVYGVKSVSDKDVNKALENGVVHYANTPLPGQLGNTVIVGHSSNNIFNSGKYKFAFVLLSRLTNGDIFYLEKDGVRYTYEVYEKKIVKPTDLSVLNNRSKPSTVTLITCDPPGTTTNRLVVVGEQISPNPSKNKKADIQDSLIEQAVTIPGDAPSLWSKIVSWLF